MSAHEAELQKALIAHLRADQGVQAVLGTPARIWDGPPEVLEFPHLLVGRSESRPVRADGGAMEQTLTLIATSRFRGGEEAKAILAAVRTSLEQADLEEGGIRTVSLRVLRAQVHSATDGRRTFATIHIRAVTEDI